jgi:hypothetical protein
MRRHIDLRRCVCSLFGGDIRDLTVSERRREWSNRTVRGDEFILATAVLTGGACARALRNDRKRSSIQYHPLRATTAYGCLRGPEKVSGGNCLQMCFMWKN